MDEIRISNTARYTSNNFTPPTATFTNNENTKLLIQSDDASQIFTDSSSSTHTVTAFGDAKHQPPFKKIGTSSLYFDGSGDYLTLPKTDDWQWTGDFTIETWFYLNSLDRGSFFSTSIEDSTTGGIGLLFEVADNKVYLQCRAGSGGNQLIQSAVLSTGQWYHVALVRSGTATGNTKIYLDGVALGTTRTSIGAMLFPASVVKIGKSRDDSATTFDGYMDEFRISDSARYTANFTPSTTAFTTDANTQLLIHGDSSNPRTQVGQGVGNAIGTAITNGGLSAAFDGTLHNTYQTTAGLSGGGISEVSVGKDWGISYETGDRTGSITVTTNGTTTGSITNLVNGVESDDTSNACYFTPNNFTVSGKYIRFQFGSAQTLSTVKLYNQNNGAEHLGTWKWQGSNDGTTWTDISDSYILSNNTSPEITSLSLSGTINTTSYTYYQVLGVSGTGHSEWLREFEFGTATGVTKTISGFKVYSTSNDGLSSSTAAGSANCSLTLLGSNTNNIATATELGSLTDLNFRQMNHEYSKLSGITTTTAYRYHWIKGAQVNGTSGSMYLSEVQFFEGDTPTDSSYAPEVIGKVAQLHGWAVNY